MDAEVAVLKSLAEPTRLRLAVLLAVNGETCVCRLAEALEAPQFRVSRHLGIMRDRGLVEARREGTWMHYQLATPRNPLEAAMQNCLRGSLTHDETVLADQARLEAAACRTPDTASPAGESHEH